MAKINVGEKMENFVFDTPYKRGMDLKTIVGGKKPACCSLVTMAAPYAVTI